MRAKADRPGPEETRCPTRLGETRPDARVRLSLDRLEESVASGKQISFKELAGIVNLSPSRLRHLFRQSVGLSPCRHVRLLRMREAKRLLDTTFLSVKEIMSAVGRNDLSHFVRDFKRHFGQAPGRYRRSRLKDGPTLP